MIEVHDIGEGDEALLEAFHGGIYRDAFAKPEPLDVWKARLWSPAPYRLRIRLARDGAIVGGVCFEHYPRSRCGLITYLVVEPRWRGQGLGERLHREAVAALQAAGAPAVFGELATPGGVADAAALARFRRWGARIVGTRYIQPALGPGLARDRDLLLLAYGTPPVLPGAIVRDFIAELHELTEGRAADDELTAMLAAIPETVTLA